MATTTTPLEPWLRNPTFEVFPSPGIEDAVATKLPPGSRVAVTHSPRQGLQRSIEIAGHLAGRGFEVIVHLGSKGVGSRTELGRIVEQALDCGIREAFVVGGDGTPAGPYSTAMDLMTELERLGRPFARLGVGGHPEGHPHASESSLVEALIAKQSLGATYIATQMCFEAQPWLRWADTIAAAGIKLPISVGVPGVVSRRKLLEVGLRAGTGASLRALKGQRGFARRALSLSDYAPEELLHDMIGQPGSEPITGVHLFTFNSLAATSAWVAHHSPTPAR